MITIFVILTMFLITTAFTFAWVVYTKNENEKDIKKAQNIFASIMFYGVITLLIIVTFIYN